jgi:pimeloyl-[acyl-carrier protein] synthase
MTMTTNPPTSGRPAPPQRPRDRSLGLYRLLDPAVLADPYALYDRLRTESPVHWDPMLHVWVVTRYQDVLTVLQRGSAARTPEPEQMEAMGLQEFNPIAYLLKRQMIFMDPPDHTRIRRLTASAFTPHRVETLRQHIHEITDSRIAAVRATGRMDVVADLAIPLPSTVIAEMLGVPLADWEQLKVWTSDFAEVLGNFQYNPDRVPRALHALKELTGYLKGKMQGCPYHLKDGFITDLMAAEERGDKLSQDEIVANTMLTMSGGQETTSILITNSVMALLRNPEQLRLVQEDPSLIPAAVEEVLRYESPIQYTARVAPEDMEIGGQAIRKGQAIMAVLAAANRDPERFPDPNRMDIHRENNRHVSFGWAAHFCYGAPLARLEAQIALESLLQLPNLRLDPAPLTWHENQGFRGPKALPITFNAARPGAGGAQAGGAA